MMQATLDNWRDRLANYEYERSLTSDPNRKFDLKKQIEECKREILSGERNLVSNPGDTVVLEALHKSQHQDANSVTQPAGRLDWQAALTEEEDTQASAETVAYKRDRNPRVPAPILSAYDQAISDWQNSGFQDSSKLLSGEVLGSAIRSIDAISPESVEHFFLVESIVSDAERTWPDRFGQLWSGDEALLKPHYEKAVRAWLASNGKRTILLLRDNLLQQAIDWSSSNGIDEQERIFLVTSIVAEMSRDSAVPVEDQRAVVELAKNNWARLRDKVENPYVAFKEILSWTECQPFLTQKMCELLTASDADVLKGEESQKIRDVVKRYFTKDSENPEIAQHFHGLYALIVRNESRNSFWPLFSYRTVLKQQEVSLAGNEIREGIRFLEEIGMVVERSGEIRVRNCIYQSVFNEDWVERIILSSRPYAQKFIDWLDSGCQNDSYLLNSQELQAAMLWMQSNSIASTDVEDRFLAYSLDV